MKVYVDEIPENKTFKDYPEDTIFIFREFELRYDLEALKQNIVKRVSFKDPNYDKAVNIKQIKDLFHLED